MSVPASPAPADSTRFALRSTRVVTPADSRPTAGSKCQPLTVLIREGTIESILPHHTELPAGTVLVDHGNLPILPGLVDTHVHINDPDGPPRIAWEGFDSATRAAAAGGVTTLVDMPLNCAPVTTNVEALEAKRRSLENMGGGHVDVGFHAGLVDDNADQVEAMLDAGVLGVKAFLVHSGISDFPAASERTIRKVAPILAERKVPLLAHAELDAVPAAALPNANARSYARYVASRPPRWETAAIEMLLRISRETGMHVHIVHLATEEPLPQLAAARKEGVRVTVETCPHYLYFAAEDIPDGATHYKCAPPIRGSGTRASLWHALGEGDIDMIASDHSPCPPELKRLESGDFSRAWGGISSLQLSLPIAFTAGQFIHRGKLPITRLAQWLSAFPAQLVGLQKKGAIAPGKDADLVVFDPNVTFTVDAAKLHHRHKLTPYEGHTLQGEVVQTYLRGELVYDRGRFPKAHTGKPLCGR